MFDLAFLTHMLLSQNLFIYFNFLMFPHRNTGFSTKAHPYKTVLSGICVSKAQIIDSLH